jgi:hypothetical protein
MRALVLAAVACSGSKAKSKTTLDDAPKPVAVRTADAAVAHEATQSSGSSGAPGKGDASIRVEWHDVPIALRQPGPCGPPLSPTTTWGIPDTVVIVDATGTAPPRAPRLTLDRCLRPPVQIATDTVTIASARPEPATVTVTHEGSAAVPVELPIAGHAVLVPVQAGRTTLAVGSDQAWVVTAGAFAAVTDGSGVAVLRELPTGTYAVSAWSPASGRSARGEITVVAGQLAEVTLQLQP